MAAPADKPDRLTTFERHVLIALAWIIRALARQKPRGGQELANEIEKAERDGR